MRFYPFGSSSLNQIYNTTLATTASVATYAVSASHATRTVSASYALSGVAGIDGFPGTCSYLPGATGDTGPQGFGGAVGGISEVYTTSSGI